MRVVDVDYVMEFANMARNHANSQYFGYLSYVRASPQARHALSRLKGEV
jgi:hypothetical protein